MKYRCQPLVTRKQRFGKLPVLLLVEISVAVGFDRGRHVDRLAEVGSLEVQRCAVVPEACLRENSIYPLPAVVADLAHDVSRDADLDAVKLRALEE